jgi:hypothetical protein
MSKELVLKSLDEAIKKGVNASTLVGFEKAFELAEATKNLEAALTPEYMNPIMGLAGSRLGFKTDKDSSGGYQLKIVKSCLIEAVLTGVNVVGNQFNIIAGNCYITKEGFGYLLKNIDGLKYSIIPGLPRLNKESTSGAIEMLINWEYRGVKDEKKIEFGVKVNKFMGIDGVVGKATRKARKWLYEAVTGLEIGDGDVQDIDHVEMGSNIKIKGEKESLTELEFDDLIKSLLAYEISLSAALQKYKGFDFSEEQKAKIKEAGSITEKKLIDIVNLIIAEKKELIHFKEFYLNDEQFKIVEDAVIDNAMQNEK